ncbi:MAG: ribose 5-phosphate isomerase A [Legionellales bacterium RIFCSPHIGHO2_12_FULL_37_14]|nr:MAG: ribose 5-phosphate isomerase A [Legionellales bacterium RIFCSPHIGHO2_12_FULL_37_14]
MQELKKVAAQAALQYVKDHSILGIGSGSTVDVFIELLADIKERIEGCVAASVKTEHALQAHGILVVDLNSISEIPLYIDGADEVNHYRETIKGGGGALTREKVLACAAKEWVCIVDESKLVSRLGRGYVPVEVIPMARSFVGREIVKLGGDPVYREGVITDNQNIILDIYHLEINNPILLEETLQKIPGVVECGIFAKRVADSVIIAGKKGITKI